jgi:hypothetical protein
MAIGRIIGFLLAGEACNEKHTIYYLYEAQNNYDQFGSICSLSLRDTRISSQYSKSR